MTGRKSGPVRFVSVLRELDARQRSVVLASFLGWTLDAFDYFLLVFIIPEAARAFHVPDGQVIVSLTLTLALRPVGAFIFGRLADRFGRRPVLIADIVLFAVLEAASSLAPTLSLLLVARALFGIAMGGEWGIGASLVMESVPGEARGAVSGLLQEGYAAGYLGGALCYWLLFDHIHWRGMLALGILPSLLALYVRRHVPESPVWEAAQRSRASARSGTAPSEITSPGTAPSDIASSGTAPSSRTPDAQHVPLLHAMRGHWARLGYLFVLMMAFNMFSHGSQDLYPTFLKRQMHFQTALVGGLTVALNAGAIVGGLFFGAWSEKVGRRKAIAIAALLALPIIPPWAYGGSAPALALGVFFLQICVQGAWGVVPVHLNELSPDELRGTLPGFAYQGGNLLASFTGPLLATIAAARRGDYAFAMSVFIASVAVLLAIVTWLGPEAHGKRF